MIKQTLAITLSGILMLAAGCGKQSGLRSERYGAKAQQFYTMMHNKYHEAIDLARAGEKDDLVNCVADKNKDVKLYSYIFGDPELSHNTPLHKGYARIKRDLGKLNGQLAKIKQLADPSAMALAYKLEDLKEDLIKIKGMVSRHPEFRGESKFSSSHRAMKNLNENIATLANS